MDLSQAHALHTKLIKIFNDILSTYIENDQVNRTWKEFAEETQKKIPNCTSFEKILELSSELVKKISCGTWSGWLSGGKFCWSTLVASISTQIIQPCRDTRVAKSPFFKVNIHEAKKFSDTWDRTESLHTLLGKIDKVLESKLSETCLVKHVERWFSPEKLDVVQEQCKLVRRLIDKVRKDYLKFKTEAPSIDELEKHMHDVQQNIIDGFGILKFNSVKIEQSVIESLEGEFKNLQKAHACITPDRSQEPPNRLEDCFVYSSSLPPLIF